MSPYPAQFHRDVLIEQAWEIAARDGVAGLSLARIAEALGVKAPSLYHHVRGKAELLKAVNELTIRRLFVVMDSAFDTNSDKGIVAAFTAVAAAYRASAHAHPVPYALAFATSDAASRPDVADLERLAIPYQERMASITGIDASLVALRGLMALMHGYVMLELHDQFRRGGDLEITYTQLVAHYLASWRQVSP